MFSSQYALALPWYGPRLERALTHLAGCHGGCHRTDELSSVQAALHVVVPAARIKKSATCHTLRHSFATHLLEDGVSIRQVSTYLRHSNLASTLVYLHVTETSESRGREVQERLLHYVLRT